MDPSVVGQDIENNRPPDDDDEDDDDDENGSNSQDSLGEAEASLRTMKRNAQLMKAISGLRKKKTPQRKLVSILRRQRKEKQKTLEALPSPDLPLHEPTPLPHVGNHQHFHFVYTSSSSSSSESSSDDDDDENQGTADGKKAVGKIRKVVKLIALQRRLKLGNRSVSFSSSDGTSDGTSSSESSDAGEFLVDFPTNRQEILEQKEKEREENPEAEVEMEHEIDQRRPWRKADPEKLKSGDSSKSVVSEVGSSCILEKSEAGSFSQELALRYRHRKPEKGFDTLGFDFEQEEMRPRRGSHRFSVGSDETTSDLTEIMDAQKALEGWTTDSAFQQRLETIRSVDEPKSDDTPLAPYKRRMSRKDADDGKIRDKDGHEALSLESDRESRTLSGDSERSATDRRDIFRDSKGQMSSRLSYVSQSQSRRQSLRSRNTQRRSSASTGRASVKSTIPDESQQSVSQKVSPTGSRPQSLSVAQLQKVPLEASDSHDSKSSKIDNNNKKGPAQEVRNKIAEKLNAARRPSTSKPPGTPARDGRRHVIKEKSSLTRDESNRSPTRRLSSGIVPVPSNPIQKLENNKETSREKTSLDREHTLNDKEDNRRKSEKSSLHQELKNASLHRELKKRASCVGQTRPTIAKQSLHTELKNKAKERVQSQEQRRPARKSADRSSLHTELKNAATLRKKTPTMARMGPRRNDEMDSLHEELKLKTRPRPVAGKNDYTQLKRHGDEPSGTNRPNEDAAAKFGTDGDDHKGGENERDRRHRSRSRHRHHYRHQRHRSHRDDMRDDGESDGDKKPPADKGHRHRSRHRSRSEHGSKAERGEADSERRRRRSRRHGSKGRSDRTDPSDTERTRRSDRMDTSDSESRRRRHSRSHRHRNRRERSDRTLSKSEETLSVSVPSIGEQTSERESVPYDEASKEKGREKSDGALKESRGKSDLTNDTATTENDSSIRPNIPTEDDSNGVDQVPSRGEPVLTQAELAPPHAETKVDIEKDKEDEGRREKMKPTASFMGWSLRLDGAKDDDNSQASFKNIWKHDEDQDVEAGEKQQRRRHSEKAPIKTRNLALKMQLLVGPRIWAQKWRALGLLVCIIITVVIVTVLISVLAARSGDNDDEFIPSLEPSMTPSLVPSFAPSEQILYIETEVISGSSSNAFAGSSLSFSADGSLLAVGYKLDLRSGAVRVFSRDGTAWTRYGNTIAGNQDGDEFGSAVALSGDGRTVAIGAPRSDDNGVSSGHTQVFRFNTARSAWEQRGSTIVGPESNSQSGLSVSMSGDGNRLAVGAPTSRSDRGTVEVRSFQGQWSRIGQVIVGDQPGELMGISVSLSDAGDLVAIGSRRFAQPGQDRRGRVSVHRFIGSESFGLWRQVGGDIVGGADRDQLGQSVSLSSNGTRVAAGANGYDSVSGLRNVGSCQAYDFNGTEWRQVGSVLGGLTETEQSGFSIALSGDGTRLACGGANSPINGDRSGVTRLYREIKKEWFQIGEDFTGTAGSVFGSSLALSETGDYLAIGAPRETIDVLSNAGNVQIYSD